MLVYPCEHAQATNLSNADTKKGKKTREDGVASVLSMMRSMSTCTCEKFEKQCFILVNHFIS